MGCLDPAHDSPSFDVVSRVVVVVGRVEPRPGDQSNGGFRRYLAVGVLIGEGLNSTEDVEKRAIGGGRRAVFPGDDGRGAR